MLISTLTSLVSFSVILWSLSADFTLPGTNIALPGFLFWVALVYAAIGTAVTHLIGRSLVGLFFARQKYEANFRFGLARLREYGEQIALMRGEDTERASVMSRFGDVFSNYLSIVALRKRLIAFTAFYGQISPIIPYVLTAPFYFLGKVTLGIMTQTASAFGNVNDSLNFFVTYYTSLADYRSVLDRLRTFDEASERAQAFSSKPDRLRVEGAPSPNIAMSKVSVDLPDGRASWTSTASRWNRRPRLSCSVPPEILQSTLFRAIAGIWPYGHGRVATPDKAQGLVMPQKPYFPVGSLRAAIAYPQQEDVYSDDQLRDALEAALLPDFVERLYEVDNWTGASLGRRTTHRDCSRASGQARLAVPRRGDVRIGRSDRSRALRDGAASPAGHDGRSIGHRSTLNAFHKRKIEFPHLAFQSANCSTTRRPTRPADVAEGDAVAGPKPPRLPSGFTCIRTEPLFLVVSEIGNFGVGSCRCSCR